MVSDPRKLRPIDLCRLLNSTPLGEVISEQQLRNHRTRAGLRIGDGRHVDLFRYVAWLVQQRHAPKPKRDDDTAEATAALAEVAEGAAALGSVRQQKLKFTKKQESLLAALLTESSCTAAAAKAGVSRASAYRWMQMPEFRAAYRRARREIMESTMGRIQTASGQATDVLLNVARQGHRDGDRLRAATAILDRAFWGLTETDLFHDDLDAVNVASLGTADVVKLVSTRLQQLDQAELSTSEKSRLTATLTDALLRAIGVDVLDKRLEALQDVLQVRKEKKR